MIYYPSQLILKIHYTFLYFLYLLLIFNRLKYYKENYKRINYYCIIIVKHRVRKNSSLWYRKSQVIYPLNGKYFQLQKINKPVKFQKEGKGISKTNSKNIFIASMSNFFTLLSLDLTYAVAMKYERCMAEDPKNRLKLPNSEVCYDSTRYIHINTLDSCLLFGFKTFDFQLSNA